MQKKEMQFFFFHKLSHQTLGLSCEIRIDLAGSITRYIMGSFGKIYRPHEPPAHGSCHASLVSAINLLPWVDELFPTLYELGFDLVKIWK